jgi:hypothetical protein
MPSPCRPSASHNADTPLTALGNLDLSTSLGMALLRRFDAALHRLPEGEARRHAVSQLVLQWPLARRGEGLMVVPGGALAWRQDDRILACDPASATLLAGPDVARMRAALVGRPCQSVVHEADGLRRFAGLPPAESAQAATLLAAAELTAWLPAAKGWNGPALLRWGPEAVLAWEMAPVPGRLALAISILGEVLAEDTVMPRHWWEAPTGDDRYQLLSSGLSAHLDEVLANEVSDALRFALVAYWTDGEESAASQLADGLGLLPACFDSPRERTAGLQPLASWPGCTVALADGQSPSALFAISPAEAPERWTPASRQGFLRAARDMLEPGSAVLLTEAGRPPVPLPLEELGADRLARQGQHAMAVQHRLTAGATPLSILHTGAGLAQASGMPVLLAVPAWGLCHLCDPCGGAWQGNAAWFGFAGGLEDLAEAF